MSTITLGGTDLRIEKNGFGCLPIQRVSVREAAQKPPLKREVAFAEQMTEGETRCSVRPCTCNERSTQYGRAGACADRPPSAPFGGTSPARGEAFRRVREAAPFVVASSTSLASACGESSLIPLLRLSPPNPRLSPLGFGGGPK